jgi:hypothetical protein
MFRFFTPPRAEQSDSLKGEGNDQNSRQISVCYHSGSCWSHAFKVKVQLNALHKQALDYFLLSRKFKIFVLDTE